MIVTVRDYLNQYPDAGIDLLTPAGLVKIPPRQGQDLLSPGGGKRRFAVCGSNEKISASDLLEQQISKIVRYRHNPWSVFILTNAGSSKPDKLFEQMSFLSDFPQIIVVSKMHLAYGIQKSSGCRSAH